MVRLINYYLDTLRVPQGDNLNILRVPRPNGVDPGGLRVTTELFSINQTFFRNSINLSVAFLLCLYTFFSSVLISANVYQCLGNEKPDTVGTKTQLYRLLFNLQITYHYIIMRSITWGLLLCLFYAGPLLGQSSANYLFSTAANASLSQTTNVDPISFTGANLFVNNSTTAANAYVPTFDFIFMGKRYNVIVVNVDGVVSLSVDGNVNAITQTVNGLVRSTQYPPGVNTGPAIAPFWDDLKTAVNGRTAVATVAGTAPYRCVVIEWNSNINQSSASNTADGVFQLRIYESTGKIEFVYGKMSIGTGSSTVTASIGFAAGTTSNSIVAVSNLSTFTTTTSISQEPATRSLVNSAAPGDITQLSSNADGARRIFSFSPPACNGGFTAGNISRVLATSMQLNWSGAFTNHLGYLVYRSVGDSNNFQPVATLPVSATGYTANNLSTNTRYYWKVIPYTEGNTQTVLSINDSTKCTMAGTYSIGATGNFTAVKAARDSAALWGLGGATVWELQPGYSFSNESLPIILSAFTSCAANPFDLTLRPATGATINYLHAAATPVIVMDSTINVTLDGRAGGTGNNAITLHGDGELVRFKNAHSSVLQYFDIRSGVGIPTVAPVMIESGTIRGSVGNIIRNCKLYNRLPGILPQQLVMTRNTAANAVNKWNIITQNSFYNFQRFAAVIEGNGWQITDNSFYADVPVTSYSDTAGMLMLYVLVPDSAHHVSGNYFGGTAPNGNGDVMKFSFQKGFYPVLLFGNGSVNNNFFKKMELTTINTQSGDKIVDLVSLNRNYHLAFTAIAQQVSGNQFGGLNLSDSISIVNTTTYPLRVSAIHNYGYSNSDIYNNTIVNIKSIQHSSEPVEMIMINNWGSSNIYDNTIGTNIHAYRIYNRTSSLLAAINTVGYSTVSNNMITNMVSGTVVLGIGGSGNNLVIQNNTVSYLKSLRGSSGTHYSAAGIAVGNGISTVKKNTILHLQDSSVSGVISGACAFFLHNSHATITANLIDGLSMNESATSSFANLNAFRTREDQAVIENNFVRLGFDSAGNTLHKGSFIAYNNDLHSNNQVRHNTFYIGGSNVLPGGNAACASWEASTMFYNNIFVNERSYISGNVSRIYGYGSGSHSSGHDHNIIKTGPGVRVTANHTTLQQWQALNKDINSLNIDPNFVNPNGPTRTLDLHVQGVTPAEARGTTFQTTTYDYDGELRSDNTPVDIGADAGLYTRIDLEPPVFTVTPLPDASDTTGRFITIRITDAASGVRDTGIFRPVVFFRKVFPAFTAWNFSYGDMVSGTRHDGMWKFYIDHQLLNVSVHGNDSIQYYFAAQDTTLPQNFIATSPSAGAVHGSVIHQVSPPTTPYIYRIYINGFIIPPVVNIGYGEKYSSLTGDGGLFEGITKDSVNVPVITARIASHLWETGKWPLDSTLTKLNVKLNIVPAYDSVFNIRNRQNLAVDMIRLYNADNVTMDGSYNGSGRWLNFINTHTTAANARSTIALLKGTDSFLLKNALLQNNTSSFTNAATLLLHDGTSSNIEIRNNIFSNVSGTTKPAAGVQATATGKPVRITVAENHFINMDKAAVHFNGQAFNARLDSNHIYWNDAIPHNSNQFYAFSTGSGMVTTHQIKGNYIGGSQPFAQGSPWINNSAISQFIFIRMHPGSTVYSAIENNIIRNFNATNASGTFFRGIDASGAVIVNGNIIGDSVSNNSLQLAASTNTMINVGGSGQVVTNNFIGGITSTNTGAANFIGIWTTGDLITVKGNIIRDIVVASGASFSTSGAFSGIYSFSQALIEQNEISNIRATHAAGVQVYGIHVRTTAGLISRNRIFNLSISTGTSGTIAGIFTEGGSWQIYNNQVSLTNTSFTNAVNMYGIYDKVGSTASARDINFNSLLIGGYQASGNTSSYGLYCEGNPVERFRNNLVVNNRSGGTGVHGMISIKKPTTPELLWSSGISNYNLFVAADTSRSFFWGATSVLSMSNWRTATGGDANSYITPAFILPASQLFQDSSKGNLNIDTTNSICWYVNGKGNPINTIDADFNDYGIRSPNISAGPVDIGSHEFTTSIPPPALYVYGKHLPGGADTLSFNGRIIAIINWSNTGTLPTLGNARWYSGVWPNDTSNNGLVVNAKYNSSYLQIPATGGSGYSYSLVYYYDSSMLGKIPDQNSMVLNKRQVGVPGSWQSIPSTVDVANKKITVANQTSFSEFTATDAVFTLPVRLLSFAGAAVDNHVQLYWQVVSQDEAWFNVERSSNGTTFTTFKTIVANGSTSYEVTDENVLTNFSGSLFYRLKIVSRSGEISYSKVLVIKPPKNQLLIAVSPNPFKELLELRLKASRAGLLMLRITDSQGKQVYHKNLQLSRGLQTLTLNNLNHLPKGIYVLNLWLDDTVQSIALFKGQ